MVTRRQILVAVGGGIALNSFVPTFGHASTPSTVLKSAMANKSVPGMAAVVLRDFKAEPELVAGTQRLGAFDPVKPGARWHLGSNGKAMTATLLAKLVDKGTLDWNRPLSLMLPELGAAMNVAYRDVTLPDLLSHHAGLPQNTSDMAFFETFYGDTASYPDQRFRYVAKCLSEAPVGPARVEASYSNTGPILAAVCAERAAGKPFEALIAAEVFEPLGMDTVSFDQFGSAGEPMGHVAARVADQPKDANPRMFAPAGAMRMSMTDWAKFCIDQMEGERGRGRLLRPETYAMLHKAQRGSADGAGFALGWGAAPSPMKLTGPALTHSGSDGNWFALVCLFPKTGNGVLVASNAADSMGGDASAQEAMLALARTIAEPVS